MTPSFVSLVLLLLVSCTTLSRVVSGHEDCSATHLPQDLLQADDHRMEKYKGAGRRLSLPASQPSDNNGDGGGFFSFFSSWFGGGGCRDCIDVELVFHIITNDDGSSEDTHKWTNDAIDLQITRLNEYFGDSRFHFRLRRVTRTQNTLWAQTAITNKTLVTEMTEALHQGGSDVANIFVTDGCCITTAGWGQFPWDRGFTPDNQYYSDDRVHLCSTYMARDESETQVVAYNTLLAHEMGHWFGLMHTFEGRNCDADNDNDRVDDTPQHSESPEKGCPLTQDSCPDLPGRDPVTNFMNSPGKCRSQFTSGQIDRMYAQFNEYRRRIGSCSDDEVEALLEVRFDAQPTENEVAYAEYFMNDGGDRDWTNLKTTDDDADFDYSHQTFTRQVCMVQDRLYSFTVRDIEENGLASPGYLSLKLNGREIVREQDFTTEWATTFVVAKNGGKDCRRGHVKLVVDILFGGGSDDISWQLENTNTSQVVMTREESAAYTDKAFRRLYLEQCIDGGDVYQLTMYDQDGGNGPDLYQVYVGSNRVHVGGEDHGFDDEESVIFVASGGYSKTTTTGTTFLLVTTMGWILFQWL